MRRLVTTYMVTLTEPLSDFLRSYIALNNMEITYEPKLNTGLIFIRTSLPYHDIIKLPYFTKVTKEAQGQLHRTQAADRLRGFNRDTQGIFVAAERPIENIRITERFGMGLINGNGVATIRNIAMQTDWPRNTEGRLVIPQGAPGITDLWNQEV